MNAKILVKDGKRQFVVLPYEQFVAPQKRLSDAEDLLALRKANRADGKKRSIPLAEAKHRLGLS
jgi:hypothetical protein